MKNFFVLYFALSLMACWQENALTAQQHFQAGKMNAQIEMQSDSLDIILEAPTKGWLAVGFNEKNDIVKSDLIQARVRAGKVEIEDQYVTGIGQHPTDRSLGGGHNVRIVSGTETDRHTQIHLRLPLSSGDAYDFDHLQQKKYWVILAYSIDDDFQHHSTRRQHNRLVWE